MSSLSTPLSNPKNRNPYKLHLHRAFDLVPISWIGITSAQQVAAMADPLFEIMEAVRDRRFDEALPRLPNTTVWLSLYRDHRAMTRGIGHGLPRLWGGDGQQVQDDLDTARLISQYERANPGELSGEIVRTIKPHKVLQAWRVSQKLARREYKRHLQELTHDLRSGYTFEGEDDFGQALEREPAIYFYARVVLPAILLWQTTPQRLLRQVRSATSETTRLEAVERLIRLDPMAMHHVEVRDWVNAPDGNVRIERERIMLRWRQQGMQQGKFDRTKFKAVIGSLIQTIAERMGSQLDSAGNWHPTVMSAPQVRHLLHAAAKDRAGKANGVCDEDIVDLLDDSWSKQLRRYRPYWDKLIPQIPGPNPMLFQSGSK